MTENGLFMLHCLQRTRKTEYKEQSTCPVRSAFFFSTTPSLRCKVSAKSAGVEMLKSRVFAKHATICTAFWTFSCEHNFNLGEGIGLSQASPPQIPCEDSKPPSSEQMQTRSAAYTRRYVLARSLLARIAWSSPVGRSCTLHIVHSSSLHGNELVLRKTVRGRKEEIERKVQGGRWVCAKGKGGGAGHHSGGVLRVEC
eukprot:1030639-Rhodomonas_salina.1